jgi:hypothetical protein
MKPIPISEKKRTYTITSYSGLSILRQLFQDIERRGNFKKGITVTVEPKKSQRSLKQNKLFWKWVGEIRDQASDSNGKYFTSEYWHWYFCETLLAMVVLEGPEGSVKKRQRTTRDLSVKEFAEMLTKLEAIVISDWGLELTNPDDLYWEALGVKKK